jgi:Ca2+-binding EF-hand superfamily protein
MKHVEKEKADKDVSSSKKDDVSKEDKSIDRMKSALSNMLDKLKVKIDSTEKMLGDKLHLLDKDNDGELSIDEIKSAISTHLKRNLTDQETNDIVKILDTDMDGKITVLELLQYIESRRTKIEVEVLQEALNKSTNEDIKTK